jgi:arsenate reductase (thioredoxin)
MNSSHIVSTKSLLKLVVAGMLAFSTVPCLSQSTEGKTILFVCEHGSAKSIIAAAHFSKIAKERGLWINVISRGTNADETVPEKINKFLNSDGFRSHKGKPVQLTRKDLETADYVVAFNPIPAAFGKWQQLETWNVPAIDSGYQPARDSIILNIERIIERIKTESQK